MQQICVLLIAALLALTGCAGHGVLPQEQAAGLSARDALELARPAAKDWDAAAFLIGLAVWDPDEWGRDPGPWALEFAAQGRGSILRVVVDQSGVLRADDSDLSAYAQRVALPADWIDSDQLAPLLIQRGAFTRQGWIALYLNSDAPWPGEQPQPCWRAAFGNAGAGVWYLIGQDGSDLGTRTPEGF
ncbi:MAG: hypothetical protein P9M14_05990 [Candidatus Alcyoniella australis]|nr:hypothetical protein [Candidatus Alcyoniella australis]